MLDREKTRLALRRFRAGAKRRLRLALGEGDSASRIARGASVGFLVTALPLPGVQIPLSILAAWIVRGNKAIAVLPQFISNAGTMLPQAVLQFKIGAWFWPGETPDVRRAMTPLVQAAADWHWYSLPQSMKGLFRAIGALGADVLGPLLLGVLITGVMAALAAYPLTVAAVWAWRTWKSRSR